MPIYEYRCPDCGLQEEILQRTAGDEGPCVCPSCGSTQYRKRFSLFAVGARGSGAPAPFSCMDGECNRTSPDAPCRTGVCGCSMDDI
ncbi:MAG: zinc ribbon domain-containing protein [Bacteroidota bacterium]|nr:zinc ribbon domain-containing protein [Bacteroidota bacterium]